MKAKCDSRPPLKPQLTIELSKAVDGSVVLRCLRSDQSVTWHKHKSQYARFFPLHDLTHFAVESALDLSRGFYGLIAAGWDIADTTGKGSRGALPDEALWVEHLVGMLDAERAGGLLSGAEELNQHARAFAAEHKLTRRADLTDEQLRNIRTSAADLHGRWMTLPAGQTLVLEFGKGR